MHHIVLIGGGAATLSVLAHADFPPDTQVSIISQHPIGPGRAYAETQHIALLNRPTHTMAISNYHPADFVEWLDHNYPQERREYVPRDYYGQYLRDTFTTWKHHSQCQLQETSGIAENIQPSQKGYCVSYRTEAGEKAQLEAEKVVLAPGTILPGDPYKLNGKPNYISDPFPLSAWTQQAQESNQITILGPGLSAIDAALHALGETSTSTVTLYSRSGVAPDVRSPIYRFHAEETILHRIEDCDAGTMSTNELEELMQLLRDKHHIEKQELEKALTELQHDPTIRFATMRDQVASINPKIQGFFLDLAQKLHHPSLEPHGASRQNQYLKKYHGAFQAFSDPIPPDTAHALGRYCRIGRLQFRSGIQNISHDEHTWNIQCGEHSYPAELIINSTRSPQGKLLPAAENLLNNLVENGLTRRHDYGGITIDTTTNQLRNPRGETTPDLYAIGESCAGELYYISAMTKIRNRAQDIAAQLNS